MKALTISRYNNPPDVEIKDIPLPELKDGQVLVKIKASAINDYDYSVSTGLPKIYRVFLGFSKPKHKVLGMEMSGIVEKIDENCVKIKVGDRVASDTSDFVFGTMAEYIAIDEKALTVIPDSMSFVDAASLPHASLLALQAIEMGGELPDNANVLIIGAGGGVGTLALQLLRDKCSHIAGVDTGYKLGLMKKMGFDSVIDYKKEGLFNMNEKYDLIIDAKTCHAPRKYKQLLTESGSYISIGGDVIRLIALLKYKYIYNHFSKKRVDILGLKTNKGLDDIFQKYSKGLLKPVIDGPHNFEEAPKALKRFIDAEHFGKIVVEI